MGGMSERESDKERVCNLCEKVLLLSDNGFNKFIAEMNNSGDPVINNLCVFLESKRGAL